MMFENTLLEKTVFLCAVTVALFIIYMTRNFNHWKKHAVPFFKPIPIFGNIFNVIRMKITFAEFCDDVYGKTSGPFVGIFILDQPGLLVKDLDIVKDILVRDFDYFTNRTMATNEKYDIMGSNMLFLMRTPRWTVVRRKMTPVFTTSKMKLMTKLMQRCSEQMMEYISKETARSGVLDARGICVKYAANSITSASFGIEAQCFEDKDSPFSIVSNRIYNWKRFTTAIQTHCFFFAPLLVKLFRMKFIDTKSSKYLRDVFWKEMNEREENKRARGDLLDILIEMRKKDSAEHLELLDENVIVAQAVQFFAAGFETTSSALTFALLELARNTSIQSKLRESILNMKENHGSISDNSLQDMEYLEQVILETLRKYPILPFLDRRCNKPYTIPGSNVTLRKGDMVYIPIMAIQYDEKYYADPQRFDPDRFSKENVEQRHHMSFLAFGEGPRVCLGRRFAMLSAKCGLAHILMNYEIKTCKQTDISNRFNSRGISLQPEKEVFLEFIKID